MWRPVLPSLQAWMRRIAELGVLPTEFAARFRAIAGFRNVLVHGYLAVDLDIVARLLAENLADFREFARYMKTYSAAQEPKV